MTEPTILLALAASAVPAAAEGAAAGAARRAADAAKKAAASAAGTYEEWRLLVDTAHLAPVGRASGERELLCGKSNGHAAR